MFGVWVRGSCVAGVFVTKRIQNSGQRGISAGAGVFFCCVRSGGVRVSPAVWIEVFEVSLKLD